MEERRSKTPSRPGRPTSSRESLSGSNGFDSLKLRRGTMGKSGTGTAFGLSLPTPPSGAPPRIPQNARVDVPAIRSSPIRALASPIDLEATPSKMTPRQHRRTPSSGSAPAGSSHFSFIDCSTVFTPWVGCSFDEFHIILSIDCIYFRVGYRSPRVLAWHALLWRGALHWGNTLRFGYLGWSGAGYSQGQEQRGCTGSSICDCVANIKSGTIQMMWWAWGIEVTR